MFRRLAQSGGGAFALPSPLCRNLGGRVPHLPWWILLCAVPAAAAADDDDDDDVEYKCTVRHECSYLPRRQSAETLITFISVLL